MTYTETVEFQDDTIRLVLLGGVERGARFPAKHSGGIGYREIPRREIRCGIVHQTAGNFRDGQEAVRRLASFFTSPPRYAMRDGKVVTVKMRSGRSKPKVIGGGRGWPGIAYTFVIPTRPAVVDGRFTVYRIWEDQWRTWHTGGLHNSHGVGIAVVGSYQSRHAPRFNRRAWPKPDDTAVAALDHLVGYLAQRYAWTLGPDTLLPHSEAGKPACPGDFLEQWVRDRRNDETAVALDPSTAKLDSRSLDNWRERQGALVALGFEVGSSGIDGIFGHDTRSAVEAFQASAGITVDGIWGPVTEAHVRAHLARL